MSEKNIREMNFKFFRADKVQKIEGGPVMTVFQIIPAPSEEEENRYKCKWFEDESGMPWNGNYPESSLILIERPR